MRRWSTHGPDVGLPKGQMGNSEVGHTNIGAGRVVAMDLGQIDLAIEDGSFAKQEALTGVHRHAQEDRRDGAPDGRGLGRRGARASRPHLIARGARSSRRRACRSVIHAITDGRDVPPKSAAGFVDDLLKPRCPRAHGRDGHRALLRHGPRQPLGPGADGLRRDGRAAQGDGGGGDAARRSTRAYADGKTDEFIPATVIGGYDGMQDGDGLFCLNFRADRAREILAAIGRPGFRRLRPRRARRTGRAAGDGRVFRRRTTPGMTPSFPSARSSTRWANGSPRTG